ncbi:hypothetical protein QVD17_20631 [Tagetes erecta]|uniref:Protein TILLER ANGLE CONTROL 1 n=1 Tax=Tagetes erecta TaxID=13708 RepID=A0AAD8NYE1_TARER|nr:hypothetical protein QVD17_20631 [Tagetes erecta]
MKIFSWVHRQFLHKVSKNDHDNDKVALLENDGWILAIGTLGVDLYQDFKAKDEIFMNDQVLFFDGEHNDDEMASPLVQKACEHVFDDHVEKQDLSPCDEVLESHQENVVVKDAMKVRKRRERTTLADLLREDSEDNLLSKLSHDHKIKAHYNDDDNNDNDIGIGRIKSFLISKTKKKLGGDDLAQPIKKTRRLMKKMLRKKIHPDNVGLQNSCCSIMGAIKESMSISLFCNYLAFGLFLIVVMCWLLVN